MTLDYNAMAQKICDQVLALQNAIATRAENPNIPTMQEVTMQVRLLGCIDKLQKFAARDAKAAKEQEQVAPATPPPVTQEYFDTHLYQLQVATERELDDILEYNGRKVSRLWLVYNMLQYCKPVAERAFIVDVAAVRAACGPAQLMEQLHVVATKKAA